MVNEDDDRPHRCFKVEFLSWREGAKIVRGVQLSKCDLQSMSMKTFEKSKVIL